MSDRRTFLATGTALVAGTAGCLGILEDDSEDRQELYEDALDAYGDGETAFDNAMEDFERGEELFRDESYTDAERYFRDAERGFDSAVDSFTEVRSVLRELEEMESVLGDAQDIVEDSWEAAISFSSSAQFHRQAAEMGADSQVGAQAQFDAGQQTIEEEGYSRTVVSEIELMGEFSA